MGDLAMEAHEFIKELTAAGLTERQAEIIARYQASVAEYNLAIKRDIEAARKKTDMLKKMTFSSR